MEPANYIYATAKIRVLEKKIPDKTDIERMVDAPNVESAFKVLNDTDYADNLLGVMPINYRDALKADFQQLYVFLKDIIPNPRLYQLIMLERDFINIKLFFKEKYFGAKIEESIRANAVYPPELLRNYIFQGKDDGLDPEVKKYIDEIDRQMSELQKTSKIIRPDFLDTRLTQKYFELKLDLTKKLKNKFITNYIKTEIDSANLLTYVRAKRLGLAKEKLIEKFINGGHLGSKKFISRFTEEMRSVRPLVSAGFDKKVVQVFDEFCEKNNLFEVEKAIDNFKIKYVQQTKMITYGPEVIFAYYLAKQNAIQNIRIILTGKLNRIPAEEIKKTLREIY